MLNEQKIICEYEILETDIENETEIQLFGIGSEDITEDTCILKIENDIKSPEEIINIYLNKPGIFKIEYIIKKDKKITTLLNAFNQCNLLYSIDLSNLDFTDIISVEDIFNGCERLKKVNFKKIKTDSLKTMKGMFKYCSSIESVDLSDFNTKKVTKMEGMFQSCLSLTEVNINTFNIENVINLDLMFYNCPNLISLDLSNLKPTMMDKFSMEDFFSNFEQNNDCITNINAINFSLKNKCIQTIFNCNTKLNTFAVNGQIYNRSDFEDLKENTKKEHSEDDED